MSFLRSIRIDEISKMVSSSVIEGDITDEDISKIIKMYNQKIMESLLEGRGVYTHYGMLKLSRRKINKELSKDNNDFTYTLRVRLDKMFKKRIFAKDDELKKVL